MSGGNSERKYIEWISTEIQYIDKQVYNVYSRSFSHVTTTHNSEKSRLSTMYRYVEKKNIKFYLIF